jgi:ubiquinone/menaquinone biosynthesis C-methylase UbiE
MTNRESSHRLDDEQARMTWQNPEVILNEIGLKPGMTFVDIGCGQGFFTIPAAKIVGNSGKVYASDINQTNINKLREKVNNAGLTNVNLETAKADDFENPLKVLANAHSILKPTGKLVNLDWKKESMEIGPPLYIRFSERKAKQLLEASGFKVQLTEKSGLYHYIVITTLG